MTTGIESLFENIATYISHRVDFKGRFAFHDPGGDVILAFDSHLTPNEYYEFARIFGSRLKGVINYQGTTQDHYVIVAQANNTPVVIVTDEKAQGILENVSDNVVAFMVAPTGQIVLYPSEQKESEIRAQMENEKRLENYVRRLAQQAEGKFTEFSGANACSAEEVGRAFADDFASQIVLLRTEAIAALYGEIIPPTLDEVEAVLSEILAQAGGHLVVVRGYDRALDKDSPAFAFSRYDGSNWGLEHPLGQEVNVQLLWALINLGRKGIGNFKFMFPMIESADNVQRIGEITERTKEAAGWVGELPFEFGVMAETGVFLANIAEIVSLLVGFYTGLAERIWSMLSSILSRCGRARFIPLSGLYAERWNLALAGPSAETSVKKSGSGRLPGY
jgi:phosphoenolpyruvate-protein kinase (PTS system EI component)